MERFNEMRNVFIKIGKVILAYGKIILAGLSLICGLILIGIGMAVDLVARGIAWLGSKLVDVFNFLMTPSSESEEVTT